MSEEANIVVVDGQTGRDVPYATPRSALVAAALLRHRRAILGVSLAGSGLVALFTLLQPRQFVSTSSFVSRSPSGRSQLAGIAAQLGISAPSVDASSSPEFFGALVRSRTILDAVMDDSVTIQSARRSVLDVLSRPSGDSLVRRELAARRLRLMSWPEIQTRIGLVRVNVRAEDPSLAREINARLLFHLERFYRESRQQQAAAERAFAEGQLAEAGVQLRSAEDRLRAFEEANRNYGMSPQLRVTHERLARDISMHQQVYTALVQSRETARLDEARSVPVISLVDPPSTPVSPEARFLALKTIGAFLVLLLAASLVAIARENSPFRRARPEDVTELRQLVHETWADLRSPRRLLHAGKRS